MPPVACPGGNPLSLLIAGLMADNDSLEKRFVDHTERMAAGCARMREAWTEANSTTNAGRTKARRGDPYFVAISSEPTATQRTNSLKSLLAFHEKI
mmetsp:Transcript_16478/g.49199  ORF Transcript_16478/g.49199 Transcript_16478/m.49199 type:complete len:96 (-) Transcript_16478:29-316(-)